jgi:hypothetical protein
MQGTHRKNRHKNSRARRWAWAEPFRRWEKKVRAIDREERALRSLDSKALPTSKGLVDEVLRLASPTAYPSLDSVVPGTRDDLARAWISARLDGVGDDAASRFELAARIAPSPDFHLIVRTYDGKLMYKSTNSDVEAIGAVATVYAARAVRR